MLALAYFAGLLTLPLLIVAFIVIGIRLPYWGFAAEPKPEEV